MISGIQSYVYFHIKKTTKNCVKTAYWDAYIGKTQTSRMPCIELVQKEC